MTTVCTKAFEQLTSPEYCNFLAQMSISYTQEEFLKISASALSFSLLYVL